MLQYFHRDQIRDSYKNGFHEKGTHARYFLKENIIIVE